MNIKIQIEKPCAENFGSITNVSGGKFCSTCTTKVIDFTKMSLDEIQVFFTNQNSTEKICGHYNARHTSQTNSFTFINKLENYLFKTRFRKAAVWTISLAFFLLNSYKCMGKRVERPMPKNNNDTTQKDTIVKPR
ncbi:MAG: hypothetical protein ABIP51_14120 [Bacteroidia bacterium]